MIWKEEDLVDVAVGKQAMQSSISQWSSYDDASRACDPNIDANFAFHTAKDDTYFPWWMVDLEEQYPIEYIKVYNRNNYQERIKTLCVEISSDKLCWTAISNDLFVWDNLDSVEIHLSQSQKARYVRLSLREKSYFHLKKVKVFVRRYPGLILSGRLDAFGSKMLALINAKYLASKTGFKFGFTWTPIMEGQNEYSCYIDDEKEIFDEKFLKEHFYGDTNISLHSNEWKFSSIKQLSQRPFEHKWGWNCSKSIPFTQATISDLNEEEYRVEFKNIWNTFPFSSKILHIIEEARTLASKIGKYCIVHIRNGDNLYDDRWRMSFFSNLIVQRIFPLEVAMEIIKQESMQNNRSILIFGVDNQSILSLKKYMQDKYNLQNLFCAGDVCHQVLSHTEQTFFDFAMMVLADTIYTSKFSTYTTLASMCGNAKTLCFEEYLSSEQIISSIENNINALQTHLAQKSASLSYLYTLAIRVGLSVEERLKILLKGFSYKENFAFVIEAIHLLLQQESIEMANELIHEAIKENEQEFLATLFTRMPGRPHTYKHYFEDYLKYANKSYPWLLYVSEKIKGG